MPSDPEATELLAAIYERGDALRRRRLRVRAGIGTLLAFTLVTVPAVVRGDADETSVRMTDHRASTNTTTAEDGPTTTTTTASATTTAAPRSGASSTTEPCRNAWNRPECGPFYWDPEPVPNQPPKVTVLSVTPSSPVAGQEVTVRIRLEDPDSPFTATSCENTQEWGDGVGTYGDGSDEGYGCHVDPPDCLGAARNGPHDPPEPRPSSFTIDLRHRYATAGTYTARLRFSAFYSCASPYSERTSVEVTIAVAPPPRTTLSPLLG